MKNGKITAKQYERKVAAFLRRRGFTVVRADHANYMPDFLFFNKYGGLGFAECKRYLSMDCPLKVLKRIKKRQAKQWARMVELSMSSIVEIHIMTKGGKESSFWLINGRVSE